MGVSLRAVPCRRARVSDSKGRRMSIYRVFLGVLIGSLGLPFVALLALMTS